MKTTSTARTKNFLPLCVYMKRYDSRMGNHSYAMWTTGEAYVVQVGDKTFASGYFSYDRVYPMYEKDLQKMGIESYKEWETIPFSEISLLCQKDLADKMGELFPWDASFWGTKEKFEEYWEPQTLEGKIKKSLRDKEFFYTKLFEKPEWKNSIQESKLLEKSFDSKERVVVLNNGKYFLIKSGIDWATLEETTPEEGEEFFKKAEELEAQEASARKEHARKCGVMARKYGIKFEISLRCFKGNEEEIKNFVESLKKAFGKDFDSHELSCGRYRRRTEIDRLGINISNVDPNHIANYILECLEAGEIVK